MSFLKIIIMGGGNLFELRGFVDDSVVELVLTYLLYSGSCPCRTYKGIEGIALCVYLIKS